MTEKMTEEEIAKCRTTRFLLEPPAPEVVGRLLATLDASRARVAALEGALSMLYDKWENGVPCTENTDGMEDGPSLGNAFRLSKEEEDRVLALLPKEPSALSSGAGEGGR